MNVLVVEDHDDSREGLCALVRLFGAAVRGARDGREALHSVGQHKPDLIICDLVMPGMDGFELVRRLRANWDLCRIRTIAVSGLKGDDILMRSWLAGFDAHLVKPIDGEMLSSHLERIFWAHPRRPA
jgi:CheY-like chemotaxis protein